MKYIWSLKYVGSNCTHNIMGDQLATLLTRRESGVFIPDSEQPSDIPDGWVVGVLKTQTKGANRLLRGKVIARKGGQWYWTESSVGTRHCDYVAWAGLEVVVEAQKSHSSSCFASQLTECKWELISEEVHDEEIEPIAVMASIERNRSWPN